MDQAVAHLITRGRWRRSEALVILDHDRPVLAIAPTIRRHWIIHPVEQWTARPIASRDDGVQIWSSGYRRLPFRAVNTNRPSDPWLSRYLETAMSHADRRWAISTVCVSGLPS
jgi:hypothetical protein